MRPHTIEVNRNIVASVLLKQYASPLSKDILDTSLSISFTAEAASDYSGLTREVFSIFFQGHPKKFILRETTNLSPESIPRHVGHCPVTMTLCSKQWVKYFPTGSECFHCSLQKRFPLIH